jgi:Zn finger protein HypA/HybF involved in hydrogenase expression
VIDDATAAAAPKATELRDVIMEFGRLLDILSEQLGAALHEADRECIAVGQAFGTLASAKGRIHGLTCDEPEHTVIQESCRLIGDSLGDAVVGLQYHDRLAQRVGHIRAGLDRLHHLLLDGSARSHDEWLELLRSVEHANRVEQQRLMAEAMPKDGTVADGGSFSRDTVELF